MQDNDNKNKSNLRMLLDTAISTISLVFFINIVCYYAKLLMKKINNFNTKCREESDRVIKEENERLKDKRKRAYKEFQDWLKSRGEDI